MGSLALDGRGSVVDDHNKYGILTVSNPLTYVIVLTGSRDRATYAIELKKVTGS